jgi:hypothetical protein
MILPSLPVITLSNAPMPANKKTGVTAVCIIAEIDRYSCIVLKD